MKSVEQAHKLRQTHSGLGNPDPVTNGKNTRRCPYCNTVPDVHLPKHLPCDGGER